MVIQNFLLNICLKKNTDIIDLPELWSKILITIIRIVLAAGLFCS